MKRYRYGIFLLLAAFVAGCTAPPPLPREEFISLAKEAVRRKFQTQVEVKEAGDTVWIYLPYTPGRQGRAASRRREDDLLVEYSIASFNPFRPKDPPELRILVQKVLGEVRKALLRTDPPYEYFVLVVTDISSKLTFQEDWHIGYMEDVRKHKVGADFAGEGYNRLTWYPQKVQMVPDEEGKLVSEAYKDVRGDHVKVHAMTLGEFVERQITWRVYRQFTIAYGKTPFDMSRQEKTDAVLRIVKTVFIAYNYDEVDTVHLRDSSFLEDDQPADVWSTSELRNLGRELLPFRKPGI